MFNTDLYQAIELLRNEIQGSLILPEDSNYDSARQTWNLSFSQYPAVILIAHNAEDIAAGIRYARAHDLGIAVQATGHGVILTADDCLLILTSQLLGVSVDAEEQTAWVEAGVLWAAVLEKSQAFGLCPLLGSSTGVGAVSYTLGGGMGWLARKYGLATDSVLEFEIVTADGEVRRVSDDENADLFWALRGGGKGIFGIVTAMRIRLFPVATVFAGSIIYPFDDTRDVFAFYREWIQYLPREWTTSISIMHFPPMPELPPFLSGRSVVMVTGCYIGDVNTGAMMIQAFMDWKEPIINTFHPMSMTESDTISNDPLEPMPGRSTGAWLKDLNDETVDLLLAFAGSPMGAILKTDIRYAGGAISDVPVDQNAYDHRSETLLLQFMGITPTAEAVEDFENHVALAKLALSDHLSGGVYMNFLEGKEAHQQTVNGFTSSKYQRLSELKAKYDPNNVFCFGYNIPVVNEYE